MILQKHVKVFHLCSSLVLAVLTGYIMTVILGRTEPNTESSQIFVIAWLFPGVFVLFNTLSLYCIQDVTRFLKICRLNQWSALWVIPFLLFGVSWRFFGSWTIVFSLFYWVYIVSHLVMILLNRQSPEQPARMNVADWSILFCGVSALSIWQLDTISLISLLSAIGYAVCASSVAILCAGLAARHSTTPFAGTFWQRWLVILIALSVPVLSVSSRITIYQVLALAISGWLVLSNTTQRKTLIASHIIASLLLVITPLIFSAGVFITFWICILCIVQNRSNKSFEGFLIPGGAIVLFLTGFFIAVIRMKGMIPAGNILYSFPSGLNWFGSLFDRSRGLLPVAPWTLTAIAGWLLVFPKRKTIPLIQWLGVPFIWTGFVLFEWLSNGKPLEWFHWWIMVPVLFPYFGGMLSKPLNSITASMIRVLSYFSILVSSILYIYVRFSGSDSPDLAEILTDFTRRTGIELQPLIPVMDHSLPGVSAIHWIWVGATAGILFLFVLTVRRFPSSSGDSKTCLLDTVFIAMIIGLTGFAFKAGQTWYVIPFNRDIHVNPGETFQIDSEFGGSVFALKVLSDLSRSTHLPQGHIAAEITMETPAGNEYTVDLLAGVHTAEWAYNRPDVLRTVQHQRPEPAWSWTVEEQNGFTFSGMTYKGTIYLDKPITISRIRIQNSETRDTGHVLTLKGLALMIHPDRNRWREARQLLETSMITLSENAAVHTFRLNGDSSFSQVILDSFLANASMVPNGASVGRITFRNKDGSVLTWVVKAGVDTAEWSAERPDMVNRVKHDLPSIAFSERRDHHSVSYTAHVYRSRWIHHPFFFPVEISLEYLLDESDNPAGEWIIRGIVLR
jgi:hypothetical protein